MLFAIGKDGTIDPNRNDNIPGLEALRSADLMIIATRFRNLPDDQMKEVVDYVDSGRPIIGMRTATHAFNLKRQDLREILVEQQGMGRRVRPAGPRRDVGQPPRPPRQGKHPRDHRAGAKDHPILRGIKDGDIWGPTDVYEAHPPADCTPLVLGQVLKGMKPTDEPRADKKNDPMMPVAWVKTYTGE